jgi:hypothetical protein
VPDGHGRLDDADHIQDRRVEDVPLGRPLVVAGDRRIQAGDADAPRHRHVADQAAELVVVVQEDDPVADLDLVWGGRGRRP